MAQQACHFSISPFSTSVMLKIDHDMLGLLPERQVLVSWLGSPIDAGDSVGDLRYEFQLKGEQAGSGITKGNAVKRSINLTGRFSAHKSLQ